MKRTRNIGYWFLPTSLFLESMWLGHLTSAQYVLGRTFGSKRAYPSSHWFHVAGGLFRCLLGFFATSAVLLDRPGSEHLAAVFCRVAIVFTSVRGLLREPPECWFRARSCLLPIGVLGYLTPSRFQSRLDARKGGQLS